MSKILKTLRRSASRIGLLIVVLIFVVAEVTPPVLAINNYGPDGYDFSAFDRVYMVVSQGGGSSLDAPYSKVYAYAPAGAGGNQTIRITLLGGDHCYDGTPVLGIDSSAPFRTSGTDTRFTFSTPTGAVVTHDNALRYTPDSTSPSGCNTEQRDFYIAVNDGDRPSQGSGLHGYYKIAVEAMMNNNGVNAFKVILPDGGIMSYTDSSGDRFALQQRVDRTWIRSDFNVYFATPCDAPATVTTQLRWYDADQGQYGQSTSSFGYRLYQRTRGTNNSWSLVHQNNNVGGDAVSGDSSYDFQRNQEYRWEWYGVSPQNGIQFQVPFDSAYAAVSCEGSDFELTPTINSNPSDIVGPGVDNIRIDATIQKTGSTASFTDEEWRVTKFIVPSGSNLTSVGPRTDPCAQFMGESQCTQVQGATNVTFTATNTPVVIGYNDPVNQSLQPGTRICYVTSVSKWASHDPSWRHTAPICVTVVQSPFAYILGNDLRVGSGFSTSPNFTGTTNRASRISGYVTTRGGSNVEYGIISPGTVRGVASQLGAMNGADPSLQGSWSRLTFANSSVPPSCSPAYGCYADAANVGKIPNVDGVLSNSALTGVQRRTTGGNPTLSSVLSDFDLNNFNSTLVLIVTGSGTLTIDRNVRYTTNPLTDGTQLPQLVIIAPNINIDGSVTQVDSWLVTDGRLNTCDDVAAPSQLRTSNCNQSLRINGPTMAGQLLLNRTHYDPTRANAAEEFNLRGDAYIWANNLSRQNGQWRTTYTTDLPPRY
ncbi:MAG: hypothetical protein WBP12_00370 [Candidatus Saccharimonas sp.]